MKYNSTKSQIYFGIGSTHLSSYAYAYYPARDILVAASEKPLNKHAIKDNEYTSRVLSLYMQLEARASREGCDIRQFVPNVVISLPGAALGYQQVSAFNGVTDVFQGPQITILDDTWATLFAETFSASGVCAIAGVGSSACICIDRFPIDEKFYKIDGWGPVIGDFGSAFDLSVEYFRRLNRLSDETPRRDCPLFPAVRKLYSATSFPLTDPVAVQDWCDGIVSSISSEWRGEFSRTAKAIAELADEPRSDDERVHSWKLIDRASNDFVDTVSLAIHRSHQLGGRSMPVVLHGEMFEWSDRFENNVVEAISDRYSYKPIISKYGPAIGSLLYCVRQAWQRAYACDDERQAKSLRECGDSNPESSSSLGFLRERAFGLTASPQKRPAGLL